MGFAKPPGAAKFDVTDQFPRNRKPSTRWPDRRLDGLLILWLPSPATGTYTTYNFPAAAFMHRRKPTTRTNNADRNFAAHAYLRDTNGHSQR
jgi:hypothetical protein